jgi:hypothetical protein
MRLRKEKRHKRLKVVLKRLFPGAIEVGLLFGHGIPYLA